MIITQNFNIVSFTVYRSYVKIDCSTWCMPQGQGHWRRHFHSQQHGELRK